MASESVHPLRISKGTPSSPPTKMASGTPRPLSEILPSEKRRNSPSWNQSSSPKKTTLKTDSSPFQSSPLESVTSPRLFWQNRNSENEFYGGRSGSPSPTRRSSIERLQKASRVKNSNILALEQKQEYDPTRIPQIERPLAKVQGNAFGSQVSSGFRTSESGRSDSRLRQSKNDLPTMSPVRSPLTQSSDAYNAPRTPSKDQVSPAKSSLSPSKFKSSFDIETGAWSGDSSFNEHELPPGRSLHRHAKSVTFDAAPPQVNEYEMATPDLSSIGTNSREGSYESIEDDDEDIIAYDPAHMGCHDDSFDASLEDTDKTPVVLPDDWRGDVRFNNPERSDGLWEDSPGPENVSSAGNAQRPTHGRTDSVTSNGDHRPLPPLPGLDQSANQANGASPASPGLSATAERMIGQRRSLPSPPPALSSKSDIQNIGNGKMTLEERLKLMMLSDDNSGKTAAEQQRERRLRRGTGRDRLASPASEAESADCALEAAEADDTLGDISGLDDYQLPPKISRESIMRRVNGNKAFERESEYHFSSPAPSSSPQRSPARSPERTVPLDPDIPIPSTEDSVLEEFVDEEEGSVIINRPHEDERDDVLDLYQDSDVGDEHGHAEAQEDDDESHYSEQPFQSVQQATDAKATVPQANDSAKTNPLSAGVPDLGPHTRQSGFAGSFESYMLPKSQETAESEADKHKMSDAQAYLQRPYTPDQALPQPDYSGSGWGDPEDEYGDDIGTPESVIHHPIDDEDDEENMEEELPKESPAIPENLATIKASGSKLKTRASNTPADLAAMRDARRQVSYEVPEVPPIPEKHRDRLSRDLDAPQKEGANDDFLERHPSFKNRSLTLDLDPGLSLDQDFERVIEAQKVVTHHSTSQHPAVTSNTPSRQVSRPFTKVDTKNSIANITSLPQRGYLMRQNTKLVAASDKDGEPQGWKARSAGNSPVKADRPQSWTVEPWNGKVRPPSNRRQSKASGSSGASGPVPPLPGQESNATALNHVPEEDMSAEVATPESGERGRLFVKVMGVKDLDLPLPKNERTWFSLTLDNGVHCVTTAWLELARNAPIGQEFELVVPNDLEFQLTLNVKLEKPASALTASSGKSGKSKTSTFSRVFASPKKRKELEMRQREEEQRLAQRQREARAQLGNGPSAYDLLSPLAAEDGSFARSYICLREHESRCFGRPYMAEISCFNEWATEEAGFASSVKSKRGGVGVVRRAPYKVGKLEVQMLFVPRPKNAVDDDMPKSMNSCIRELKAAEERLSRNFEGHLSQQGGDCPYWRRRYFKLAGTKLTAYHEATRQPRATINLANAKRLIDDRRALTEKETFGKGGKRRRSAFAEEEEGYMFVEEGFRIRFNNGEVIDFYADTAEDKESWMKVLSDITGRGDGDVEEDANGIRSRAKWCELVLKREEQLRRRAEGRRVHSRTKSTYS